MPSVTCFPQPNKAKSRIILEAFASGCGGEVATDLRQRNGASAFYGVMGIEKLFHDSQNGDWYYIDNSYFDKSRPTHFRVSKNRLQKLEVSAPDYGRLSSLGLEIKPWRKDGKHIVIVPQSDHFMREVCGWADGALGWQESVLTSLRRYTDRPMVMRHWSKDKEALSRTLANDLKNAWALVTHCSAAANEAVLAGVPVVVTGQSSAIPMSTLIEEIENPRMPDGREEWAASLAAAQWTLDEMREGKAWESLGHR